MEDKKASGHAYEVLLANDANHQLTKTAAGKYADQDLRRLPRSSSIPDLLEPDRYSNRQAADLTLPVWLTSVRNKERTFLYGFTTVSC
ncbi:hypothetical protein AFAE65S_02725 [Alcaligenes phenolicus]